MGGVILTLTPNPAVDTTYTVDHLTRGEAQRVRTVRRRPGGKGINVARVLHALGEPVTVLAPLGGAAGNFVARELAAKGVAVVAVPIVGETRTSVTVVDGEATVLNEPGPAMTATEYVAVLTAVERALVGAAVLVVSGSSPPGARVELQADLVRAARAAGVRTVVDTSGPALLLSAEAGADLLKPNAQELREATGHDDVLVGARDLLARGARGVVVSLGPEGLLALTTDGGWRVDAVPGVRGNPTGAGDAVVAGLARALASGRGWPETLADASALGAAAVLAETAGEVDAATYARFVPLLTATRIC